MEFQGGLHQGFRCSSVLWFCCTPKHVPSAASWRLVVCFDSVLFVTMWVIFHLHKWHSYLYDGVWENYFKKLLPDLFLQWLIVYLEWLKPSTRRTMSTSWPSVSWTNSTMSKSPKYLPVSPHLFSRLQLGWWLACPFGVHFTLLCRLEQLVRGGSS